MLFCTAGVERSELRGAFLWLRNSPVRGGGKNADAVRKVNQYSAYRCFEVKTKGQNDVQQCFCFFNKDVILKNGGYLARVIFRVS